jgi:hypothetical protein
MTAIMATIVAAHWKPQIDALSRRQAPPTHRAVA